VEVNLGVGTQTETECGAVGSATLL